MSRLHHLPRSGIRATYRSVQTYIPELGPLTVPALVQRLIGIEEALSRIQKKRKKRVNTVKRSRFLGVHIPYSPPQAKLVCLNHSFDFAFRTKITDVVPHQVRPQSGRGDAASLDGNNHPVHLAGLMNAGLVEQRLSLVDGGAAAWRFLFGAFMVEALQWGWSKPMKAHLSPL